MARSGRRSGASYESQYRALVRSPRNALGGGVRRRVTIMTVLAALRTRTKEFEHGSGRPLRAALDLGSFGRRDDAQHQPQHQVAEQEREERPRHLIGIAVAHEAGGLSAAEQPAERQAVGLAALPVEDAAKLGRGAGFGH